MKRRNFLLYTLLFTVGCTTANVTSNSDVTLPETLTFTVTDVQGLEELEEDYGAFRKALAEVLETNVEFFPVDGYLAAVPAMLAGKVDLVWAGPSEYLVLQARAKAQPVVSLKRPTFKSVIATRADRGIQSLADLKGKTIDMYKVGVTSSHLSGVRMLLNVGLDPESDYEIVTSQGYSFQGLDKGDVDAVSWAEHRYYSTMKAEKVSARDYIILETSPRLPGDIFVASSQLDAAVIEVMRSRILEHQDQLMAGIFQTPTLARKFKESSLISVDTDEYEALREIYRAIGQESLIQ
ncbi:MAG: phosphate/phosphite/phosphonate ABC transporter substrate-binding protein [Spirulina sp.]